MIFYDDNMKYNSRLAKLFNISCYMTHHSICDEEIQKYANDMFNYVAKNRYYQDDETKEILLLHKIYENTHFITNGNDYYFATDGDNIQEFVKIILLDYFNGRTKLKNKRMKLRVIEQKLVSDESIFNYIKKCNNSAKKKSENIHTDDEDSDNMCCDFHCRSNFNPKKCSDVIEERDYINKKIDEYTVYILDKKIHINVGDMQIVDDKIIFKTKGYFDRINFAACWNADRFPEDYIDVKKKQVTGFVIPYIRFIKKESYGYHFLIDMFNNGFIIEEKKKFLLFI